MTELIKKGKILDKIYTIVGDEGTDIILNSKGNVKIRFGNSFLNLIKNGKISSEAISGYSSSGIKEVGDKSEITSDGIYFSKADKTFYISFGGLIFEINGKEVEDEEDIPGEGDNIDYTSEDYLAISKKQKLTSEQIKYALGNLKQVIEYLVDDSDDLPLDYAYYVVDNKRHYVKTNEGLQELYLNLNDGGTVKGTVTIGSNPNSISFPLSKLNVISKSPLTLFDGISNNVRLEFNDGVLNFYINNSLVSKFAISKNGIGINNSKPTNSLDVSGDSYFNGILQVDSNGRIITTDIGSYIFTPGFTGEGFRIYVDEQGRYNAEFDNLTVRQTMHIYELILEKIRVVKGSLIISQGGSKIKQIEEIDLETDELDPEYQPTGNIITVKSYYIRFEDEYSPFAKNDLARCQVFQCPDVRGYWVWVRDADRYGIYVDKSEFEEYNTIPLIGDEVCQLGNVIDVNRQSAIYLSASDTVNPIIDILSDIKQKSFNGSIRCRLGNLKGITYGKNELKGYGLFGDNVYLKGKLVTFGHDVNNSVDIGDFYESNSVNLSKSQLLQLFFTETKSQLNFYNGDYIPGEERLIDNPNYKVPIMKYPYTTEDIENPNDIEDYEFNPKDPDNPLKIKVELNPPEASYGSIYNCTKEGITTYYLRDYEDPSDPSTPLIWRSITEYHNPKPDPLPEDFIDIDLLPIETDLCKQLNLLGTNNTLYYSEYENLPSTPYNLDDYWITTYNKIYLSLASREVSENSVLNDWAERNLAQSSIREDVANKLGYDNYQDLMTWALKGNTIIEGGYINTRLLEAEIIIGNQLIEGPYMRSDKIEIRDPNNINVTRWRFNSDSITGGISLIGKTDSDGNPVLDNGEQVMIESPCVKFLPDGTMYGIKPPTIGIVNEDLNPWRFNKDGSGSLALGNIRWDANGKITFGDDVLGTVIDEGLITTGTIALGTGDTVFVANSGITGSIDQPNLSGDNLVRFWAGGTLDNARYTVLNDINETTLSPTASFVVTQGGKLYASNANISGDIHVTEGGSIGDMVVKDKYFSFIGPQIPNSTDYISLQMGELFGLDYQWGMFICPYNKETDTHKPAGVGLAYDSSAKRFESAFYGNVGFNTGTVTLGGETKNTGTFINTGTIENNGFYIQTKRYTETITYGSGTENPYILNTTNKNYIEINSTNNRTFQISLGPGKVGQKLVLYNKNAYNTHRLEIALMQGWFWLIEQEAAEFIYTTDGWRYLVGVLHN